MCGIAGIIGFDGGARALDGLEAALTRMAPRGPDHAAVWSEREAAFGHRRMSIVDVTAAGNRPMLSHDGRHVIVSNGEVHNPAEIRQSIHLAKPIAPRRHTDTEEMLEA